MAEAYKPDARATVGVYGGRRELDKPAHRRGIAQKPRLGRNLLVLQR
jgi:hypothetical protein